MRKVPMMLTLILSATVALSSIAAAAVPVKNEKILQNESAAALPGSEAAFAEALRAPSPVGYKLLVIAENPADRTAYLDEVLADWQWPTAHEMLLVVYPKANYDVRFALGANFRSSGVTVDEMLTLVRSEYFARSQKGDVYGGLAALVDAVNKRMTTDAFQAKLKAAERAVALIGVQDAEGLLGMAQPEGVHVAPYAVGLPDAGLSKELAVKALQGLVHQAKPEIVRYDLIDEQQIRVVVKGLSAGRDVPASGAENAQVKTTELAQISLRRVGSEWKLFAVAFDTHGLLAQELAAAR